MLTKNGAANVPGPKEMAWSCVRGKAAVGEGKILHQRAVGMEQLAQGRGQGAAGDREAFGQHPQTSGLTLCEVRGWTQRSSWVPSYSGDSVIRVC